MLPVIRRLVDQRPTHGYRRITALLNRERRAQDLPPVNAKRVLRITRVNGLVLMRHTACRPARTMAVSSLPCVPTSACAQITSNSNAATVTSPTPTRRS